MYRVGLGESPMQIARRLTGRPERYRELLASNPHKSIVHVGGAPTFASLGVGEPIALPRGWLGASYADDLAAVGLHPDNPDGMYAGLMSFIKDPVAFKNADPNWPGARDDKIWWDDGSGKIALQWPFMGGKWLDAAPVGWNDAKLRAVFKIPAGANTKDYLAKLYRVTGADAKKPFFLQSHTLTHGGGIDLSQVTKPFEDAYNAAVPILAKASSALVLAAPFLSAVPLVGPGLTATALALGALGPALEKLREQGASPEALAGAAQAALAAAPGGAGATVQQLVSSAPQLGDVVSQASKIAGAATPTVQQIQQGQALLQHVIQSTPSLSSVAAKFAPHVLSPDVASKTVPASDVPKKVIGLKLGPAAAAAAVPAKPAPAPAATAQAAYGPYPAHR